MSKKKLALVYTTIPSPFEIEQFHAFCAQDYELTLITCKSIAEYVQGSCSSPGLRILALENHEENHTYLPGLEQALANFHTVIIKERVGLYAYQAVKAKWTHSFRLMVIVDNLTPWPANDIARLRTIREEVTTAADAFIVQSKSVFEMLVNLEGISKERIFYIPPYVEKTVQGTSRQKAEALRSLGFSDGDYLISVFGQIEWEEGLFDVLHGVHIARSQNGGDYSPIKLAVCGIGSFEEILMERIQELGLERFVKMLPVTKSNISQLLQASAAVFSSVIQSRDRLEGDPFKLMIAIANSIPILAGRTPLSEEFLEKWRLDFCIGNPLSIANAMSRGLRGNNLCKDIATKALSSNNKLLNFEMALAAFNIAVEGAEVSITPPSKNILEMQVKEAEKMASAGKFKETIKLIEQVFSQPDLSVHHKATLYRLIGDCFAKLKDFPSSKEAYESSLSLDPYYGSAWIGLGVLALDQNNFDLAIINFQKAVSSSPLDDMACLGLGLGFQGIKEYLEANKWMDRCLDLNPINGAGVFSIVRLSHETKDYSFALSALQRYLKLKPDDTSVRYSLAGIYFARNEFSQANEQINLILNLTPDHPQALELQAIIEEKSKTFIGTSTRVS